ncbi:unnamed protein product [Ilex paraguariensis]|uniref:Mitotic spindle checkpoint protein MAD1 n=1 Tax=Ilex paraguariensis TaxID=185542 RepID=A0ABC8TGR2_9AQUA
MMLRTPPPRKRRADSRPPEDSPNSDRRLVIYEDPTAPESSHDHITSDQMLCTYQCRQMVKSEFFDALSSAEKQAHDYQSKLEELNDNFCKTDAERKKFRDQFLYAEQELAAAKGREQALQEQLLKELKLQNEMNLRKKAESSAASVEEQASVLEGKLTHLSESTEREKSRLQNELAQLKRESKFSVSRIAADLERMELKANNAEKESVLLKEQLEELRNRLNECLHQKSEIEKKLSSLTSQDVPSTETNILVKHLQEELRHYESEVREARKLKTTRENVELLKEKLLEEKGRKERAESELLAFSEIQLSVKKLEDELSAWKLMMKDIPGVSSAEDIPLKFAALQKEVLHNMMKMGEANAHLKQMEVALEAAELGKQNAESEAVFAKEKAELSKSEVKRIELMGSRVMNMHPTFSVIFLVAWVHEIALSAYDNLFSCSFSVHLSKFDYACAIFYEMIQDEEVCGNVLSNNLVELLFGILWMTLHNSSGIL